MGRKKRRYTYEELARKLASPEPVISYLKDIRSGHEIYRVECLGDPLHRMVKIYYSDGKHKMIEYIGNIRIS